MDTIVPIILFSRRGSHCSTRGGVAAQGTSRQKKYRFRLLWATRIKNAFASLGNFSLFCSRFLFAQAPLLWNCSEHRRMAKATTWKQVCRRASISFSIFTAAVASYRFMMNVLRQQTRAKQPLYRVRLWYKIQSSRRVRGREIRRIPGYICNVVGVLCMLSYV